MRCQGSLERRAPSPILPRAYPCCAVWLAGCLWWLASSLSGWSISAADADAAFDAFNTNFYVLSAGKGYYKADTAGGRADFWKQAEEIEMIIDVYERTGKAAHKTMISQAIDGFMAQNGTDWLGNGYNDDIMWMVIACARGYLATGNTTYRDRAKYHFDAVYNRAWDTALGGGLWWTTAKGEKNACINGPAAIAACLLYEIYTDASYLDKAKAIFAWQRQVLYDPNTGKVYDNITSAGAVNTSWIFTYNQGTFLGAANYLRKITGLVSYYNDALKAATYTRTGLCTTDILPESGTGGDGGGFTSIFLRWMARFARENNLWPTFYPWLAQNANAAWSVRRADNLSWCKWRTATAAGTLASWDACTSVVVLQVLPWDYLSISLPYDPLPLTAGSYNRDIVVEKAAQGLAPSAYGTASMDSITVNNGNTWFEAGYLAASPTAGLPAAGSTVTHLTSPDHRYTMPPDYSRNNAIWLSPSVTSANLTPANPVACSGLSFLNASGHGPVTVGYVLRHVDGTTQAGRWTAPDWFGNSPVAVVSQGRVDLTSGASDSLFANNPRLYSTDLAVTNRGSAVTNIQLTFYSGANNAAVAVLAVSAAPASQAPQIAVQPLPIRVWQGSSLCFTSGAAATPPLTYQWQRDAGTGFVNLTNGPAVAGANATNLVLSAAALSDAVSYRLIASNPAGSVTSSVVAATVLSTLPDLVGAGDPVTSFGGSSPANEGPTNICNGSTSKYLNFGLNNGGGTFLGPVGVMVTPGAGLSVINGLRFYAANDEPGRDPASYVLAGSANGGATFWPISSGAIGLADTRNAGGLALDPLRQSMRQVMFLNAQAYTSYRLSFTAIKTNTASMMQVGEVEWLGVPVPTLRLESAPGSGVITLRSSSPGRLWSANLLAGSATVWTDEGAISGTFTVPITQAAGKFYRVSAP